MSPAVSTAHAPLVLVVEDKPVSLKRRQQLFKSFGCTVVGASSKRSAIHELGHTPVPDLVVTDIHMPEEGTDDDDESGIELAEYVRSNYGPIPMAGYSAVFEESELPNAKWGLFDIYFPKGGQTSSALAAQVEACVDLAISRRHDRFVEREDRMAALRREYEGVAPEMETVRRLTLEPTHSTEVSGALGEAGYRLRLVAASDVPTRLAEPFAVWLSEDADGVVVEAYGQPDLYADGKHEDAAFAGLADVMWLFHEQLSDSADVQDSPVVAHLRGFLARVLGPTR